MFTKSKSENYIKISEHKSSLTLGVMLIFWTLYEGVISYITPILITEKGYSNTQMGLLYSTSSIFGILFDLLLIMFVKKVNYRRAILLTLLICLIYPFILWGSSIYLMFVLCMAIWGLYSDIIGFGVSDFSGRIEDYNHNAKSLSILATFKSIGYILAPLITGSLLVAHISPKYYAIAFLLMAFIFFFFFSKISKKDPLISEESESEKTCDGDKSFSTWILVLKKLYPLLGLIFLMYVNDAIVWTIGPLLSETFIEFPNFGGWFLTLNMLPGLFVIFLVPPLIKIFGKKKLSYISFLGSLLLFSLLIYVRSPIIVLIIAFVSSIISYFAFPAIKSAFADYLGESKKSDSVIMCYEDIFCNIGYVVGPFIIGFLSDIFGELRSIGIISIASFVLGVVLMIITPKKISFKKT